MVNEGEVREIINSLVKDRFPGANIIEVSISEDVDFDGDIFLRVRVIIEAEEDVLDSGTTSGFLRHLRPKLSEVGVKSFPVMSFISGKDAGAAA